MARAKSRTRAGLLASGRTNRREAAVLAKAAKQIQTVLWDFSVDGGAIGTFSHNVQLPANAVVTNVYSDEQTVITSAASAPVNLKLVAGSTDLTVAADFIGDSGAQERVLAGNTTTADAPKIKLATSLELKTNLATTAATAGKVKWCVEFYVSDSAPG